MLRYALLSLVLLVCGCQAQPPRHESIDKLVDDIPVEFLGTHDCGRIELQYKDGRKIDAGYSEIDHSVLYAWAGEVETTGKNRPMILTYTLWRGAEVTDVLTGTRFLLGGEVTNHPIDYAMGLLGEKAITTQEMIALGQLCTKAWEAEVNRAYDALGGDENPSLREAHRAWIAYRDAMTKAIGSHYGGMDGTLSGIICVERILEMTKEHALLLQRIHDW